MNFAYFILGCSFPLSVLVVYLLFCNKTIHRKITLCIKLFKARHYILFMDNFYTQTDCTIGEARDAILTIQQQVNQAIDNKYQNDAVQEAKNIISSQ